MKLNMVLKIVIRASATARLTREVVGHRPHPLVPQDDPDNDEVAAGCHHDHGREGDAVDDLEVPVEDVRVLGRTF